VATGPEVAELLAAAGSARRARSAYSGQASGCEDGERGVKWQGLVIVTVAVLGAAGGAYAGQRIAPDATGVAVSLGAAGLGLGGLVGVLVSGWWRPPRKPPAADAGAASTTTEFTAREPAEPAAAPAVAAPDHAATLVDHPPPPPPPDSGEPGWYKDQAGVRRYWDGERWTEIVWRERSRRDRAK